MIVLLSQSASELVSGRHTLRNVLRVCSGWNRQLFYLERSSGSESTGSRRVCERASPPRTENQQIRDMPKGQRVVGRPSLEKLFSQRSPGKASRDQLIAKASTAHGCSQMEVVIFVQLDYSTISRILAVDKRAESARSFLRLLRLWAYYLEWYNLMLSCRFQDID